MVLILVAESSVVPLNTTDGRMLVLRVKVDLKTLGGVVLGNVNVSHISDIDFV